MESEQKNQSLISLTDVKKYYTVSTGAFSKKKQYVKAVDGVSLDIKQG